MRTLHSLHTWAEKLPVGDTVSSATQLACRNEYIRLNMIREHDVKKDIQTEVGTDCGDSVHNTVDCTVQQENCEDCDDDDDVAIGGEIGPGW